MNGKTEDSNMIDENIHKALKVLKSPRLSFPQSNDKKSNRASSRPRIQDEESVGYIDPNIMKRHASNRLQIGSIKGQGDNQFRRYRSTSRSKKSRSQSYDKGEEKEELEEFLAIEKSCKGTDTISSNILSTQLTPKKEEFPSLTKSSKRMETEANVIPFDVLDKLESRNTEGYFKPKRAT